jgi:hypothetical protein
MKKILLLLLMGTSIIALAQKEEVKVTTSSRINFVNPGFDYEFPISKSSSIDLNVGIGVGGSYKNLTSIEPGYTILLSPFYDMQIRNYYNLKKRAAQNKNTRYNSANFIGMRFLGRGPAIARSKSFYRTTEVDYAIAPVWGIQRSFNRIHLLFDVGPYFYFDFKGNSGIVPIIELNIGYNLSKR